MTLYIRRVTPADLLPDLRRRMEAAIPAPETTFRPMDAKFGWVYVNVPIDFRVASSLEPVSLSGSLSNGVVTVSATLTATPTRVTFTPGEPRGEDATCAAAGALAPYDPDEPGECAYTYRNSSAISANGRTFSTSTTVEWSLQFDSSDGSRTLDPFERTATQDVAVAEVQALVTCTGPLPAQGGC